MRVDNQNLTGVAGSNSFGSVNPVGTKSRTSSASGDEASPDVVKLSNASSLIELARNLASADRQSRIHHLATQVRSGSYQVHSQDVTQALIKQS